MTPTTPYGRELSAHAPPGRHGFKHAGPLPRRGVRGPAPGIRPVHRSHAEERMAGSDDLQMTQAGRSRRGLTEMRDDSPHRGCFHSEPGRRPSCGPGISTNEKAAVASGGRE